METMIKELESRGVLVALTPYKTGEPSASFYNKDGIMVTHVRDTYELALESVYREVVG